MKNLLSEIHIDINKMPTREALLAGLTALALLQSGCSYNEQNQSAEIQQLLEGLSTVINHPIAIGSAYLAYGARFKHHPRILKTTKEEKDYYGKIEPTAIERMLGKNKHLALPIGLLVALTTFFQTTQTYAPLAYELGSLYVLCQRMLDSELNYLKEVSYWKDHTRDLIGLKTGLIGVNKELFRLRRDIRNVTEKDLTKEEKTELEGISNDDIREDLTNPDGSLSEDAENILANCLRKGDIDEIIFCILKEWHEGEPLIGQKAGEMSWEYQIVLARRYALFLQKYVREENKNRKKRRNPEKDVIHGTRKKISLINRRNFLILAGLGVAGTAAWVGYKGWQWMQSTKEIAQDTVPDMSFPDYPEPPEKEYPNLHAMIGEWEDIFLGNYDKIDADFTKNNIGRSREVMEKPTIQGKPVPPKHELLLNALAQSPAYREYCIKIFEYNGLPAYLADLALLESNWNPKAESWVGAQGMYQFMPGTASDMGLEKDESRNEAFDPIQSAQASARYLKAIFGDLKEIIKKEQIEVPDERLWEWTLTAYNHGPGNVKEEIVEYKGNFEKYIEAAIQKGKQRMSEYMKMKDNSTIADEEKKKKRSTAYVYLEYGNYVASFYGMQRACKKRYQEKRQGLHPEIKMLLPFEFDRIVFYNGSAETQDICKQLNITIEDLYLLNPSWTDTPNSNHIIEKGEVLNLPKEKGRLFKKIFLGSGKVGRPWSMASYRSGEPPLPSREVWTPKKLDQFPIPGELKAELEKENELKKSVSSAGFADFNDIDQALQKGVLVHVPAFHPKEYFILNQDEIGGDIGPNQPFYEENEQKREKYFSLRPYALDFLNELAEEFHQKFNKPLVINSLTRTTQYVTELKKINNNAIYDSAHERGITFDPAYMFMNGEQLEWMQRKLTKLRQEGRIYAIQELNSRCFHITVVPPEQVKNYKGKL